jgi:hypothetical protein
MYHRKRQFARNRIRAYHPVFNAICAWRYLEGGNVLLLSYTIPHKRESVCSPTGNKLFPSRRSSRGLITSMPQRPI